MAGRSKTPLSEKLGIKATSLVYPVSAPPDYEAMLGKLPEGARLTGELTPEVDVIHLFAARRADLEIKLTTVRREMAEDAAVWVSWPKRTSKLPTDLTEDAIRDAALPLGFVDEEVCAITDVWSGIELVVRKELRRGRFPAAARASLPPKKASASKKGAASKKAVPKKKSAVAQQAVASKKASLPKRAAVAKKPAAP